MTQPRDLLIEIGTEELPPKALGGLAQAFRDALAAALGEQLGEHTGLRAESFASPRRLAVRIADVPDRQPDQTIDRLGPAVAAAFDDDGRPTKAAIGFARSCGVDVDQLQRRATNKGERLAHAGTDPGKPLAQLLPPLVADALKTLPIPKRMRWGKSEEAFVRPVHWLVALHGGEILPMTLFGCDAGRVSYGHRFHHPEAIELADAGDYEMALRDPGHVVVSLAERRTDVRAQVDRAATKAGGDALIHDDLLDEVTALVEWPVALAGSFDARYLQLPREVLIATLEGHQRYFPVAGAGGELLPCFVTVANIASREPERVVAGNERVIRPRLADALFFWRTDRDRGLQAYAAELGNVTFQRGLGSLADKSARVANLAASIAGTLDIDSAPVERAAQLAKADLLSEMVGEFPELQGTMGRYYAQDDEDPAVAAALEEQYAPRQAGAAIPASPAGRALALADRLDTLAGIFSLGKRPTGDKDPFALRRAALAVLRIVIEAGLDLDLARALRRAVDRQPGDGDCAVTVDDLLAFHGERLRAYYAERGVAAEIFEAVAALGLTRPRDFDRRIQAVRGFLAESAADRLCSAHKRIRNILKNQSPAGELDPGLLDEPAEVDLNKALRTVCGELDGLSAAGDYAGALHRLALLQEPVDRFFDQVLVMSEDTRVRNNRLALLAALDAACRTVADISRLSPD